jgi:hypothetical protein
MANICEVGDPQDTKKTTEVRTTEVTPSGETVETGDKAN